MGALSILGVLFKLIDPKVAAVVVLAILLPLGGYAWGHRDAAEACRARDMAAALAGAEHNIDTLNAAATDTAERTAKLEAVNGSLRAKVESYERSIANPVPSAPEVGVCRLSDADARRLRDIGAPAARRH